MIRANLKRRERDRHNDERYLDDQPRWNISYRNCLGDEQLYARHHMKRSEAAALLKKLALPEASLSYHDPAFA